MSRAQAPSMRTFFAYSSRNISRRLSSSRFVITPYFSNNAVFSFFASASRADGVSGELGRPRLFASFGHSSS